MMRSHVPRGSSYARFAFAFLTGGLLACVSLFLKLEWMTTFLQHSSKAITCASSTAYASAKAEKFFMSDRPLNKQLSIYAYENNPKTGSSSWNAELRRAAASSKNFDTFSCGSNKIVNSLAIASFDLKNRSLFISCPIRRVVFAQRPDVRIITSFFLEKELVFSNYLEDRDLNLSSDPDVLTEQMEDYNSFLEKFQMNWQVNYFGYTAFKEEPYKKFLTCPITSAMQLFVDRAAEDTWLPMSTFPRLSAEAKPRGYSFEKMVGLDVKEGPRLNVRDSNSTRPMTKKKETSLSCIDDAIAKAMTLKLVRLFEGMDSFEFPQGDWRAAARSIEEQCRQQHVGV